MSKYTPGPWILDRSKYANSPTVIRDKNNGYIAEVYLDESPDRPAFEANARLISAAPEMLRALKDALDWMQRYRPPESKFYEITQVMAAINKAEGGGQMTDKREYLGDGVFGSYDGFQVLLETDRNGHTDQIYLDDGTLTAFMRFIESVIMVKIKITKEREE